MKKLNRGIKAVTDTVLITMLLVVQSCTGGEASNSKEEIKPKQVMSTANAITAATQFAEVGGRKIAYRSIGKGVPLILCLRFRGNLDDWDPAFLDALARDFNVITFDYTGFGSSSGNPPGDMLTFAKDVKDLAETLKLQKFILGGWSFGGAVAQIVTTEFPGLVSQLILIGTRAPGPFKHQAEEIFLKTSAKPINDFEDEVILFFEPTSEISRAAAKASHDRIAKRTSDRDVYIKQELWQYYLKGFDDFIKDPYRAKEKLMATQTPILVISGDHEVVFPPENWFELNRKLPTMQLVVIPQTGHGPQQQYPEMVASYIKSFIDSNVRNGVGN